MTRAYPWLFSARADVAVFGGSAALSFALLLAGSKLGLLHQAVPGWTWVTAVLLVDVAHVWATGFRVYFDRTELERRPWLYATVPVVAFAAGCLLYQRGELVFWRCVAYLAIFHFVRQQYGWMALYRAKRGETSRLGAAIDTSAIYAATLYPLLYWHTHVPRGFDWLYAGDVVAMPAWVERAAFPLYVLALLAYVARSIVAWTSAEGGSPGKDLLVLTTAACWYVGIVAFDSDFAFTVTNVLPHGIPYIVLVVWWVRTHRSPMRRPSAAAIVATLWVLAYAEELLWDRGVWGDRPWLFGSPWELGAVRAWLVPLLAVPQLTHYVLDGFLWRRGSNPRVARAFSAVALGAVLAFVSGCSRAVPDGSSARAPFSSSRTSPPRGDSAEIGSGQATDGAMNAGAGDENEAETAAPTPVDGPHYLSFEDGRPVYFAFPAKRPEGGEPWRLIVGLHGTCGGPSYACGAWVNAGAEIGALVCPTGNAHCGPSPLSPPTWEAPSWGELVHDMDSDVERAVATVRSRHPKAFRREGAILVGYSRGGYAVPFIAGMRPGRWPLLVIIEADATLDPSSLKRARVQAVALVAGELGDQIAGMRKTESALVAAGFPAQLFVMPKTAHLYSDNIEDVMREALAFLVSAKKSAEEP